MGENGFLQYLWQMRGEICLLAGQHLWMSVVAIGAGSLIAIPLGIFISRRPRWGSFLIDVAGMLYTVPSLAMLGFLLPFLGIGWVPTITALAIYSLLPLMRNTYVGITEVDSALKEAAMGMGATKAQLLWKVELPLAFPVIMAGLRTVTVLTVGITTMGALVGAGGLGVLVFKGMQTMNNRVLLAGTIPVALLAVILDQLLGMIERKLRVMVGLDAPVRR